jgi:hypothetical protein
MQADDIKKVYTDLIASRYNNSQVLFQMLQEHNPQMNTAVYTKLQNEISGGRTEFDRNQRKSRIRFENTIRIFESML